MALWYPSGDRSARTHATSSGILDTSGSRVDSFSVPFPRRWLILALTPLLACSVADEPPKPEAAAEPPVTPAPTEPARPEPAPPELARPELEPKPATVPMPSFDPKTVTTVRARIVAIPHRKSWVPCGVVQSVAALEVEVLDVGEPPPRMLLFVSCPADRGRQAPVLEVGATLAFGLYTRRQSWTSIGGLDKDLPRRYVKSIVAAEP
jgi:hypothetical protein